MYDNNLKNRVKDTLCEKQSNNGNGKNGRSNNLIFNSKSLDVSHQDLVKSFLPNAPVSDDAELPFGYYIHDEAIVIEDVEVNEEEVIDNQSDETITKSDDSNKSDEGQTKLF